MSDEFWNCPNTGGQTACNPACLAFVRDHTSSNGKKIPSYCRIFGPIDKILTGERVITEEKGE